MNIALRCVAVFLLIAGSTRVWATVPIVPAMPARGGDDSQDDGLRSGLLADYSPDAGEQTVRRIDSDIQFNWADASPDPRVPVGRFAVQWHGKLLVPASGRYQFHFFAAGKVRLNVAGRQLIADATAEPRWLSSEPTTLEPGHHAIDVTFEKTAKNARIGLYWQSNKFGTEPIVSRWLFHERSADHEPGDFERGDELVRAFRCAACHTIPGVVVDRNAPALDRLNGAINPDWLARWIENPHGVQSSARMPAMGLSRDDARAIAGFLLSSGKTADTSVTAPAKGNPESGESLVRSLGCLACHTIGESGVSGDYGGGPLDRIAEKRPTGFFRTWLRKPESLNAAHRMPVFTLSNDEVDQLASYLATLGKPDKSETSSSPAADHRELANRGKQLVSEFRCAACHEIPGITKPAPIGEPLHGDRFRAAEFDWTKSCPGPPDAVRHRPGFAFDADDRRAILSVLAQLPATVARQSQYEFGRRLLRELNCASCHARDLDHGLQPSILGSAERSETELAKLRGELEPPSLTSVGDKFNDATLAKLIVGGLTPRRPWLTVRMPRFNHNDKERDAVLAFLVDHDRIRFDPPSSILNPRSASAPDPAAALTSGHQLVSARGFGCMSCHTVGKHQPKGVEANARGSDLLKIGDRVRHEWFLRWTRDPARIVPGMEMPSITFPVRGLLDDKLDLQIESLWQALNSPSFVVPSDRDTAQQIISLKPGDAPVILRDVMYDCPPGGGWCPRAFAIGLPNRHNVLFDLGTMSLRGWWHGDFARERTEGKSWLWEPAGLPFLVDSSVVPGFALRDKRSGAVDFPEKEEAVSGKLLSWWREHKDGFLRGSIVSYYQLQFHGGLSLNVSDAVRELNDTQSGFERLLTVWGVPPSFEPLHVQSSRSPETNGSDLFIRSPLGNVVVRSSQDRRWERLDGSRRVPEDQELWATKFNATGPALNQGDHSIRLEYRAPIPASPREGGQRGSASGDAPPSKPAPNDSETSALANRKVPAEPIHVVPGHETVRLSLDRLVMPTAITFQSKAVPIVCSLKGGVFLARDSDGDGFEDEWNQFSDHLAAPYGAIADGTGVIVSHKPELLRLEDTNGDGRADRNTVIASGWGYNEDYHDWTFGVLRDSNANLYIATANDYAQKNRPKSAQGLRGHFLKVLPEGKKETLARGLRYPTGLAMNRDGAIFCTDNQGVQNTFNEINHIVPGSRYGVPAQDDPPPENDPWPEREPAIKIPHPWTRSVNGICFLESDGKWGPFDGHGIGCEYDTRGLIRFSLQKIGDTYQGACYPFTLPEDQVPQDQRLLGPICCAVSPNGDLYVGGLRDSGWGGGNNVGELVRIKPSQNVPLGVREVRAWREGFVIDFTGPIDAEAAADTANYAISSYRRIWKGTYATPDSDRRTDKILKVDVARDRRSVSITLESMRPGFVYDIHLAAVGPVAQVLWPADAYYTLNQIPDEDAPGR